MQSLTNLDTAFLHLEKDSTPMHVGGVMLFAAPADGAMTFDRFRRHVGARLQTARVFRQRLHTPPALMANPVWIEDPDFRLDNHLRRRTVHGPLTHKSLESLCSKFFSTPLRRDQPLWEMMFVRTADAAGGFAVLLKVHHCALDGVSAEAVITGLLDFTPEPRPMSTDNWQPETAPTVREVARRQLAAAKDAPARLTNLLQSTADIAGRIALRTLTGKDLGIPHYFGAPRTDFNRPIGTDRSYFSVQLSLTTVKEIKNTQPGFTVNDVVLAICAGATRRYLKEVGSLPETSLVAMAPVSRRAETAKVQGGNQVSSMLIRLGTDIADPVQRLRAIHANALRAKEHNREVPVDLLMNQLPSAGPGVALTAYSRLNLSRRLPPMFNMVITNVPGSPLPLYLDGAMLRSIGGMAGIYDNTGLTLVVMSYLDKLSISVTSSPESVQKPERLAQYLEDALAELAKAVLPEKAAAKPTARQPQPA
ncbi:MAG TPA: wax ester/triacylglycerol synthase family O-acyltransferase [Fluviicoccus sp.]|nr:wax ester/triacylglycerol synthase family O-acyltransferase [Fluviicoccus sp.]